MYVQQKKLGIGLITPKIIVAILAFKLYIRNKRANSKVAKLIEIIEEAVAVEYGKNSTNFLIDRLLNNTITWTEQINTIMRERSIEIVNNEAKVHKLTSNKTITQFINEYVKTNKL